MQTFTSPPRVSFDITQGDVAGLPDRRLQTLAHYWFARRGPDGLVPRAAIDPLDFPALLPNIMLLDRIGLPPDERYRFRLAGTEVVNFAGRELTGRHIDELLPDTYHDYVRLLNRTALEKRLPVYTFSLYHDQGNFVNGVTYRLVMPVASQAASTTSVAEPDMIFVCQFWQRRQEEDGFWTGNWQSVQPEIRLIAADRA
jgi:hypothetical protein